MRVLFTMSYNNIALNIIPTLYEGYIVSVHGMVMENRPVYPGGIQRSHRPISFIRIKHKTRERIFFFPFSFFFMQLSTGINNHVVRFSSQNHIKIQ